MCVEKSKQKKEDAMMKWRNVFNCQQLHSIMSVAHELTQRIAYTQKTHKWSRLYRMMVC